MSDDELRMVALSESVKFASSIVTAKTGTKQITDAAVVAAAGVFYQFLKGSDVKKEAEQ